MLTGPRVGSSSGQWSPSKYGCIKAYSAVSRLSGSKVNNFSIKSIASWLASGKIYSNLYGFLLPRALIKSLDFALWTALTSFYVGVPKVLIINSI